MSNQEALWMLLLDLLADIIIKQNIYSQNIAKKLSKITNLYLESMKDEV